MASWTDEDMWAHFLGGNERITLGPVEDFVRYGVRAQELNLIGEGRVTVYRRWSERDPQIGYGVAVHLAGHASPIKKVGYFSRESDVGNLPQMLIHLREVTTIRLEQTGIYVARVVPTEPFVNTQGGVYIHGDLYLEPRTSS